MDKQEIDYAKARVLGLEGELTLRCLQKSAAAQFYARGSKIGRSLQIDAKIEAQAEKLRQPAKIKKAKRRCYNAYKQEQLDFAVTNARALYDAAIQIVGAFTNNTAACSGLAINFMVA